jgi:hypothetical protein
MAAFTGEKYAHIWQSTLKNLVIIIISAQISFGGIFVCDLPRFQPNL